MNASANNMKIRALFVLVLAFLVCFLLYPLWCVMEGALSSSGSYLTWNHLFMVFSNPIYQEGLWNSFLLAFSTTGLVLVLALPLAILADRFDFHGKRWLTSLVLVPMVLPPFVGAIGLRQILGRYGGSLNLLLIELGLVDPSSQIDWLGEWRFLGVVLVESFHLYPILYLNAVASLANIDPALSEAARSMGGNPWQVFRRITLPLMSPGLFAGGTIVFIFSFTELGTPLLFEYRRVTAVQIFDGLEDIGTNHVPYVLVVVMLVTTLLLYLLSKWIRGRRSEVGVVKAIRGEQSLRLPFFPGIMVAGPFVLITILATIPHFGVLCTSLSHRWVGTMIPEQFTLQHYHTALGHSLALPSISNSLGYAIWAVLLDLILGLAIAYIVVRTRLTGRHIIDALAMLPLAVPGLVIAFGYVSMTKKPMFSWLDPSRDPTLLLVVAYAVRRLPYVVRSLVAGFEQVAIGLEEAGYDLGASTMRVLFRITGPLILPNMIAGGLLAFSFAVLEVSDSLILAQKMEDYPVTKAIFDLYQRLGDGPAIASALGVWAMLLLSVTIIGASLVLGKRLGSLFRV